MTTLQAETEHFLRGRAWRGSLMDARLALVGVRAPQPSRDRKRAKRSPLVELADQPARVLRRTFPTQVRHR